MKCCNELMLDILVSDLQLSRLLVEQAGSLLQQN